MTEHGQYPVHVNVDLTAAGMRLQRQQWFPSSLRVLSRSTHHPEMGQGEQGSHGRDQPSGDEKTFSA